MFLKVNFHANTCMNDIILMLNKQERTKEFNTKLRKKFFDLIVQECAEKSIIIF